MKVLKIIFFSLLITICIFSFKDLFSINIDDPNFFLKYKKRVLQLNTSQLLFNLKADIDYTVYKEKWDLYCKIKTNSTTFTSEVVSNEDKISAIGIFQAIFRKDDRLNDEILQLLKNDSSLEVDYVKIIMSIVKLLIPSLILIGFSLFGWFTCCSCCCYEYCPIICKRDEDEPITSTSRLVPVILVVFTAFSLIIPSIMSFNKFNLLMVTLEDFYCKMVNVGYVMGK
jgi:hypothetical protein